jgi:hypothetical protein
MRPSSADPSYLSAISAAIYKAMTSADPGCVWVMQAWLFFSDSGFWQPPQIKVRPSPLIPLTACRRATLRPGRGVCRRVRAEPSFCMPVAWQPARPG